MAEPITRRALILGADGEKGRAVAVRLAAEGMKLALCGGDARALMRTAALTGRPLDMLVLPADPAATRAQDDILRILTGHFKGLEGIVDAGAGNANGPAGALIRHCLPLLRAGDAPRVIVLAHIADAASFEAMATAIAGAGVRLTRLDPGNGDDAPEAVAARVADALRED